MRLKTKLLGFTEEENKIIDECKGDFSVISGVRRQLAYTMLHMSRCLVQYWYSKNPRVEIKRVGDAFCDIL